MIIISAAQLWKMETAMEIKTFTESKILTNRSRSLAPNLHEIKMFPDFKQKAALKDVGVLIY